MFLYFYYLAIQQLVKPVLGSVYSNMHLYSNHILGSYLNEPVIYCEAWFWICFGVIGLLPRLFIKINYTASIVLYALSFSVIKLSSFAILEGNENPHYLAGLQFIVMYCACICTSYNILVYIVSLLAIIYSISIPIHIPAQIMLYFCAIVSIVHYNKRYLIALVVLDASIWYNVQQSLDLSDFEFLFSSWHNNDFIQVIERKSWDLRIQRAQHSIIGAMYPKYHDSAFKAFYVPDALVLTRTSLTNTNCLIIGLGVGISTRSMVDYGLQVTVVELNPKVVQTAQTYFDLPKSITITIADGANYIKQISKYDFIIHDVFSDGIVPGQLYSQSFLDNILANLKINGLLVINFVGDTSHKAFHMFVNTLKSKFTNLRCFGEELQEKQIITENCFCFASLYPIEFRSGTLKDANNHPIRHQVFNDLLSTEINLNAIPQCQLITNESISLFEYYSRLSYKDFWTAMQKMMPAKVWIQS